MQSDLNESIGHNDLRGLIGNIVSVDQYKSKVGNDENIVVLAIKVRDQHPCEDLSQFIESGFELLDVDKSTGPNENGEYTVFVELERNSELFDSIDQILNDVKQVDNNIEEWLFTVYGNSKVQAWSKENFDANVISDSYDYVVKYQNAKPIEASDESQSEIAERLKFLNNY